MRKLFARFTLMAVLMLGLAGCPQNAVHVSAEAAAKISAGLAEVQKVDQQLYAAGEISADEAKSIDEYVVEGATANDMFVDNVRNISKVNPKDKASLILALHQLNYSLTGPRAQGLYQVHSKDAQDKILAARALIDAGLSIAEAFEQGAK